MLSIFLSYSGRTLNSVAHTIAYVYGLCTGDKVGAGTAQVLRLEEVQHRMGGRVELSGELT